MSQSTASLRLKVLFLSLSVVSLVLCALGATAHYLKWAWANPWQLVGWLLSMVFLLIAFLPGPSELRANFKSVIKPKTAFFVFWILFFVVAHLWNFRTAPWNGNGLFEDASVDLLMQKPTSSVGHSKRLGFIFMGLLSMKPFFITICGRGFICLVITF